MNLHQVFIILFLMKIWITFQLWDENFHIYNEFQSKRMQIHIDQGVNFSKLAKKISTFKSWGKLLLAHFACILAHCAASRFAQVPQTNELQYYFFFFSTNRKVYSVNIFKTQFIKLLLSKAVCAYNYGVTISFHPVETVEAGGGQNGDHDQGKQIL